MLKPRRDQVVAWRGPMLDRALVQLLGDVFWGDLDVLLLDLPPGTGDVAISLGQHLANAEVLVVTTPQQAAAEVAERAGTMASMMHQRVVGVVENMSYLPARTASPSTGSSCSAPAAATGWRHAVDGGSATTCRCSAGCRSTTAARRRRLRHAAGETDPDAPAATGARRSRPDPDPARGRGLAGLQLGLSPAGRGLIRTSRCWGWAGPSCWSSASWPSSSSAPTGSPSSPSRPAASCARCGGWSTTPRATSPKSSARSSRTSTCAISTPASWSVAT